MATSEQSMGKGCGGSQQQGRVWGQPKALGISPGPGPGQPQLGHHPAGSASRQGRAVGRWRSATGTDPWGLEWAVGQDRMGEALEEEHLRCSMQLQDHLQPSCSIHGQHCLLWLDSVGSLQTGRCSAVN